MIKATAISAATEEEIASLIGEPEPMSHDVLQILGDGMLAIDAKATEVCEDIAELQRLKRQEPQESVISAACEMAAQAVVFAFNRVLVMHPSYPLPAAWHLVMLQVQQRALGTLDSGIEMLASANEATTQ